MDLTDKQMLAAKRLRELARIDFPASFALVALPEVNVEALAEQEVKLLEADRKEVVLTEPNQEG